VSAGFHFPIQTRGMLTVARCTLAVVWTQVMGSFAVSGVEVRSWEALDTLPSPRELLQSLVVIGSGTLLIRGMECCSTHSLACSQVTDSGRRTFAVRARSEKQGTNTTAHGGGDAVYAEAPRRDTGARLASLVLDCRIPSGDILSEEILKVHTAAGSMVDLTVVGCTDLRVAACPLVLRIDVVLADNGRVVVEVRGG
jgi:hypothetical protein